MPCQPLPLSQSLRQELAACHLCWGPHLDPSAPALTSYSATSPSTPALTQVAGIIRWKPLLDILGPQTQSSTHPITGPAAAYDGPSFRVSLVSPCSLLTRLTE
jgi:hypothetical protein